MRALSLIVPLTLIGCLDPTQITVELYKDGEAACEPMPQTAVTIAAAEAIDASSPAAVADTCTADTSHAGATARIGSIVAVPNDDPSVDVAIEAMMNLAGNDPASTCVPQADDTLPMECILARRQLRFIEHTPLELPIVLQVACGGVLCDDDKTCVNGNCVDAQVDCDNGVCDEPEPPPLPEGGWPVVLEGIGGVDLGGMARDAEGNVYVAGTCGGALKVWSPGVANPPVVGDPESGGLVTIFVIKLSAEGELLTSTTFGSSATLEPTSRAVRDLVVAGDNVFVGAEAFPGLAVNNGSFANANGGLLLRLSREDLSFVNASAINANAPAAVDLQALAVNSDEILGAFNYTVMQDQTVLGLIPPVPTGVGLGALQTTSGAVAFLYPLNPASGNNPPRVSAAAAAPDGSLSFLAGINEGPIYMGTDSPDPVVPSAGAFLAVFTPQRMAQNVYGFATDAQIRITGLGAEVTPNRICAVGTVEGDASANNLMVSVTSVNTPNTPSAITGDNAKFGFVACPVVDNGPSGGADGDLSVVLGGATRNDETVLLDASSRGGTLYVGGWASSPVSLANGDTVTAGGLRPFVASIEPMNESVAWSVDLDPPNAKLERLEIVAVDADAAVVAGQIDAEFELTPGDEPVPPGRKVFIRSVSNEP